MLSSDGGVPNFVYLFIDAHHVPRTTKISTVVPFFISSFLTEALSVLNFSSITLCLISFLRMRVSLANL